VAKQRSEYNQAGETVGPTPSSVDRFGAPCPPTPERPPAVPVAKPSARKREADDSAGLDAAFADGFGGVPGAGTKQ
jgi:hypothetical protein